MTNSGPAGMSFPQKVHTEDGEFVIELDENHMTHDGYGLDERTRCKRRKRCGQCGPCQVKENCMKCHFCIRKDVLKQTCIYRKCVYLRLKLKPYSRLHQNPHSQFSPSREASPRIRSPETGMSFPEPGPDNLFFPQQLPLQPPHAGSPHNNGFLDRTLPHATGNNTNINMQMNLSPQVSNHATSPPVQKGLHPTSPPLVSQHPNSPPSIPPAISSCGTIPHLPTRPHMSQSISSILPSMSNNSLATMAQISSISNLSGIGERSMNDFRHSDQFALPPHHPHPHYPAVHPHLTQRDQGLFGDHARISHLNFNTANHVDSFTRGPNDSCMYHPGLPYTMQGHFQPNGPSFLSGASDVNPFRTNFLNTFQPGYSYPPDRYREGFGPLSFPRLGMTTTPSFPQYPGQGAGYGMGNSFPQQYYNSQHGCPKNGSRPPVSPSTDDVKVLQAGYKQEKISPKSKSSPKEYPSSKSVHDQDETNACNELTVSDRHLLKCHEENKEKQNHRPESRSNRPESEFRWPESQLGLLESPQHCRQEVHDFPEHLHVLSDFFHKSFERRIGVPSQSSKSLFREPWRTPIWFSPRQEDMHSRASTSTMCSEFECEVISIDDQLVNAFIRFDGCNNIEIELDNKSMCLNDSSSRRLPASRSMIRDFLSPLQKNCFQLFDNHEPHSLFHSAHDDLDSKTDLELKLAKANGNEKENVKNDTSCQTGGHCGLKHKHSRSSKEVQNKGSNVSQLAKKFLFKNSICLRQDLGNEGVVLLELPGNMVTIEDTVLSEKMKKQCSNLMELKEFLGSKPNMEITAAG